MELHAVKLNLRGPQPPLTPQLQEYARMVCAKWPEKALRGVAINWMSEGALTIEEVGVAEQSVGSLI